MSIRIGPIVISQSFVSTRTARILLANQGDGTYICTVTPEGFSRQWQLNGVDIAGATNNPYTITAVPEDVISCVVLPLGTVTYSIEVPVISATPDNSFGALSTGRLQYNLSRLADWTVDQPFSDVMRTSRRLEDTYTSTRDENGWPTSQAQYLVLWDQPAEHTDLAGRYRLTWEGNGSLQVSRRVTNIDTDTPGQIDFDFTPAGSEGIFLDILTTDPAPNNVRNVRIIKTDNIAAFDAGDIWRPEFKALVAGTHTLRFMEWQGINDSTHSDYADLSTELTDTWQSYASGPPVTIMVKLCNDLGVRPWFCFPHLFTDAAVTEFVQTVYDNLNPDLVPYFEYSNEVWNNQFQQMQYWVSQGDSDPRVNNDGDANGAWMQLVGERAQETMDIVSSIFTDREVVRVHGVQADYAGLEVFSLTAPDLTGVNPVDSFDAIATTGYFDGGYSYDVAAWNTAITTYNAEGEAACYRQLYDAMSAEIAAEPQEWTHHRGVADTYNLDMIMYEGGSHAAGQNGTTDDALMLQIVNGFHKSAFMGQLYTELMTAWDAVGDGPFNQFATTMRANDARVFWVKELTSLADDPRTDVCQAYNLGLTLPTYSVSVQSGIVAEDARVAMNGHSITNELAGGERTWRDDIGIAATDYHYMTGPYAGAEYRYNTRNTLTANGNFGENGYDGFTSPQAWSEGGWDALISIVQGSATGIDASPGEIAGLANLFQLFYSDNPTAQGFVLKYWQANFRSGGNLNLEAWRDTATSVATDWETVIDGVNATTLGGADVVPIPFLEVMVATYDAIVDGNGPAGFTAADLIVDEVHASPAMSWAGAVATGMVMFGFDPDVDVPPLVLTGQFHQYSTRPMVVTEAERSFLIPIIKDAVLNGYDMTVTPVVSAYQPNYVHWSSDGSDSFPFFVDYQGSPQQSFTMATRIRSTQPANSYQDLISLPGPLAVIAHRGWSENLITRLGGEQVLAANFADRISILLNVDRAGGLAGGATAIAQIKVGDLAVQTFTHTGAIPDEINPTSFYRGHQSGYLFQPGVINNTFDDFFGPDDEFLETPAINTSALIYMPSNLTAAQWSEASNNRGTGPHFTIAGTGLVVDSVDP